MVTIAVINQKGGVGKTTTTCNLGAGLARAGKRVLLIDLDPQANLTSHLVIGDVEIRATTYDLLRGEATLDQVAVPTTVEGLYLAPAAGDLAAAEVELVSEIGRESILRDRIGEPQLAGQPFDFVFIDCPPSLGLLATNALTAAEELLVPIQAEFFALAGIARLVDVKERVKARLNPALELAGIVFCMWKGQANLSREVRDEVKRHFGDVVYDVLIRQNVKLAEAPSAGKSIFEYDPESNGAQDYAELTAEFLSRHSTVRRRDATTDLVDSAGIDRKIEGPVADENESVKAGENPESVLATEDPGIGSRTTQL